MSHGFAKFVFIRWTPAFIDSNKGFVSFVKFVVKTKDKDCFWQQQPLQTTEPWTWMKWETWGTLYVNFLDNTVRHIWLIRQQRDQSLQIRPKQDTFYTILKINILQVNICIKNLLFEPFWAKSIAIKGISACFCMPNPCKLAIKTMLLRREKSIFSW